MKPANFFTELKRRKVFKVGAAYLVVAWLAVQAASIGFPAFDAPPWALRIFILVALLGFPIAVVMAWVFDLTPEGVKLDAETSGTKRLFAAATLLIVLALGWYFYGQPSFRKGDVTTPSAADKKSIAVLPFDNLSRDPDNAYFCEGVQDEILTRLAKVADLKVISRTSTQHFKSSPGNLPEIAKQLGVMHILEGSVQKASDQVRVNVQLINTTNDEHLWAETYDRKLTDIFGVESDIAKSVADVLQAKLTGSEKNSIAKRPSVDPEAYELYLKGRFFWNKRSAADLRKSIAYLNQAIVKDPDYALAYAALADSCAILRFYGGAALDESIVPARAAAKKALELDDSLAEAHASLGLIATEELELDLAVSELKRAVQLNANYATGHHWLGLALTALGQFDEAIREGRRALELDPLSMIINADLSVFYLYARGYDLAEAQARKALEIAPQSFLAHYYLGMALQSTRRLKEAMPEFQKAVELNNDPYSIGMLVQAYARNGQPEEARRTLARLNEVASSGDRPAYALALAYTSLGEKEHAIQELEQAYNSGNRSYLFLLKVDPFLDDLRGQPRFETLVKKVSGP